MKNGHSSVLKTNSVETVLVLLITNVFSFFFLLSSPLHPWRLGDVSVDSGVFKLIALMMRKGYFPYRDTFDHKGPLLYLINYLGDIIHGYKGVWIFEFISLTLTFFFMYKTARLVCNIEYSIIATLAASSLLFSYFDGGNYTEEYAMSFIAISIYIFANYYLNNKITKLGLIVCGFCLGCVLMLRVNMIALWAVLCISVLIKCLVSKEYSQIFNFLLWFAIGITIIILPLLIWLSINGALTSFAEDYILFNFSYSSEENGVRFHSKWQSFFTFFEAPIHMLSFVIMGYVCKHRKSFFNITYLIYMITTLLFICVSGQIYEHYGMIMIPALVYPFACCLELIQKEISDSNLSKIILSLVCIYLIAGIILPAWMDCIIGIPKAYKNRNDDNRSEIALTIAELIDSNTNEGDCISVYGNWDYIYVISNRKHATKYSYQYPIGKVNPTIMDEYMEQLQKEMPHIIVVKSSFLDNNISSFISKNDYNLLWSEKGSTDISGALVYIH